MDKARAIRAFAALAQESRLGVFRLLVRTGADGLAAGEIARALEVPHNTMSSHLAILSNAGLVMSRREGRSIIYAIDLEGTRRLLSFLMEDCCQGKAEVCAPLIACVLPECCGPDEERKTRRRLDAPAS
jgi:DNA-binding transcriptional ArsR family regulator